MAAGSWTQLVLVMVANGRQLCLLLLLLRIQMLMVLVVMVGQVGDRLNS